MLKKGQRPAGKPCSTPKCKGMAVKLSYAGGGAAKCHWCWKKDPRSEHQIGAETGRSVGGRTNYLPKSHVSAYQKAYVDSELVSCREDLATMEAQAINVLQQIKDDPRNSRGFVNVVAKTIESQKGRIKRGSLTYVEAYNEVCHAIEAGVKPTLLWQEYYQIVELKRKLVQTEAKRLSDLGWTPEQVFKMVEEIIDLLPPLMPEDKIKIFMQGIAASKLFNNDQMALQDLVRLEQPSVDSQLLLQEINSTPKFVDTEENNGTYEPSK